MGDANTNAGDAELVGTILAGNREAFAEVVRKYQNLICALAYSATGDLARSEDLAQETFVAAWQRLAELREPAKLRSWLCGIARHLIQDLFRREKREPIHGAEELELAQDAPSAEAQPSEQTVSQDEKALLWHSLEKIPATYREPLILYYRENQSVEQVAGALDLTEDTVRQRLVRGRNLLHAEVTGLVEGALRRTAPSRAFTVGVMQALPMPIAAAASGGAATAAAKTAFGLSGFVATLFSWLMPLATVVFHRKLSLALEAGAASEEERAFWKRQRREFVATLIGMVVGVVALNRLFLRHGHERYRVPVLALFSLAFGAWMLLRIAVRRSRLRDIWRRTGLRPVARRWEYRTATELFGQPIIHIRLKRDPQVPAVDPPVKAWIAVGNIAHGRLVAVGTVAVAPLAIGVMALGVVGFGVIALAGFAVGGWVIGGAVFGCGMGIGWLAVGGGAWGAYAAYGGWANARVFAGNPPVRRFEAFAPHANEDAARAYFAHSPFFSRVGLSAHDLGRHDRALLFFGAACVLLWIVWVLLRLRRPPSLSK